MTRRAITLIELLLATMLLTLIAAACLPVLQRALADLRPDETPDVQPAALADAVHAIREDPAAAGLATWPPTDAVIPWPSDPDRPPIRFRRVLSTHDHLWVEAASGGRRLFFWAMVPEPAGDER